MGRPGGSRSDCQLMNIISPTFVFKDGNNITVVKSVDEADFESNGFATNISKLKNVDVKAQVERSETEKNREVQILSSQNAEGHVHNGGV